MAWPLPPHSQPCDGQAHTLARDSDPMHLFQVLPQERGGPDRRVVAQFAGIGVDDFSDQRIDDPQGRGGPALARGIRQSGAEIESLTLLKALRPVVDRLATDMEPFGDLIGCLALGEPEHGLGTAAFPGRGGMEHEVLQVDPLPVAEYDRSHRDSPRSTLLPRWAVYLSKNFWPSTYVRSIPDPGSAPSVSPGHGGRALESARRNRYPLSRRVSIDSRSPRSSPHGLHPSDRCPGNRRCE